MLHRLHIFSAQIKQNHSAAQSSSLQRPQTNWRLEAGSFNSTSFSMAVGSRLLYFYQLFYGGWKQASLFLPAFLWRLEAGSFISTSFSMKHVLVEVQFFLAESKTSVYKSNKCLCRQDLCPRCISRDTQGKMCVDATMRCAIILCPPCISRDTQGKMCDANAHVDNTYKYLYKQLQTYYYQY